MFPAADTRLQITGRPESLAWLLLGGQEGFLWLPGSAVFGALEIDFWGSVAVSHVTRVGEGTLPQGQAGMPDWLTDKGIAGTD